MTRRRRWSGWISEALVIAALMLLPLLFWWRLWALDPADRAVIPEGDFTSQYYPLQLFSAQELAVGRLPAWNPYLNAGQPGLADIQTGAFYPLNLVPGFFLALFGVPFTLGQLTGQVILHFSLASLFTYLFVRHLACRAGARVPAARFAGAMAALSFTYAGYLTSFPVQQLTILETSVWLPLVLFFLDRSYPHPAREPGAALQRGVSIRSNPRTQVVFAGLALACGLLAGHPQTALYLVYTTVAYGLFRALTPRTSPDGRHFAAYIVNLVPLVLALLLGFALASVQLIPTIGFVSRSTRAGLDYDGVSWGFPLAEVTHLLYPGYFGSSPQYVGILSPVLAAAALFLKRARREVVFWVVVGSIAFLLAFGGHTFFYSLFYLLAPGFGAVRDQERVIYLFSFAISVLAGYGALTLVMPLPGPTRARFARFGRGLGWIFAILVAMTALFYFGYLQGLQQDVAVNMFEGALRHHVLLLLVFGAAVIVFRLRQARPVRRNWLVALALGAIWLNLFTVNWRFNLADPVAGGPFPESDLVRFLQQQGGAFRISSAGLLPGGASAGIVYQLEDVTANTPLRLESFEQFESQVGDWRRWQLLNVRYVLDRRELDGPGLERVYEEGDVKVYEIGDPLPRAWVVHSAEVSPDDQALARLNAAEFDPRTMAILSPESDLPVLSAGDVPSNTTSQPPVKVVERGPGRLVLDLPGGSRGLLVISQPYYPGWRARMDGVRVPIHRVNYLLQGILVEPGSHRVELDYHLSPWPAVLSLVALAAVTLLLAFSRRWRIRRPSQPGMPGPSEGG